jgi:ATP-binding cassette, subfamily B, bacterial
MSSPSQTQLEASTSSKPEGVGSPEERRKRRARWRRIWQTFIPFARPHRGEFGKSCGMAVMVVGFRLALPWPIREILKPWLNESNQAAEHWYFSPWAIGSVFLFLVIGLGYSEFRQRVHVARFAIAWVRDIRAQAFRSAYRLDPQALKSSSGDLVARLVGDTARLKAGLKGFLTHVATNGLFFLGVGLVMMWIDPLLGLIVLASGIGVCWITLRGAERLYKHYLKLRKKEGRLADRIQEALDHGPRDSKFAKVNYSSGHHETHVVRIQGITTLASHTLLGVATFAALLIAFHGLKTGRLETSQMLLFFFYMLELHRPMVRLSRQGTRFGKMMACGNRLERVIHSADLEHRSEQILAPLSKKLVLKEAVVSGKDSRRLGPLNLTIRAGEQIAILGTPGSGKSTLLALIAGQLVQKSGKILWDGSKLHKLPAYERAEEIIYLPENPQWMRQPLDELICDEGASVADPELLQLTGADQVLTRFSLGLKQKLSSQDLSAGEARHLDLARVLHSKASVLLLDDPLRDLDLKQSDGLLRRLEDQSKTALVVLAEPKLITRFSRAIVLQDGQILYDGMPAFMPVVS